MLVEAFDRDDVEFFVPLKILRRMAQDADFARDQLREHRRHYRNLRQMISDGVMFGPDVYQEKPRFAPPSAPVYQQPPQTLTEKTIRSEDRTPRKRHMPLRQRKEVQEVLHEAAALDWLTDRKQGVTIA